MKQVLLIDDHDMVGTAFGAMIEREPGLELCGVASTLEDGHTLARQEHPDVIVTDLRLGDGVATDHITSLREASGGAAVLVVTGAPTQKAIVDALEAGALGFLAKVQPMQVFLDAIHTVAAGHTVVAPEFIPALVRNVRDVQALTDREIGVVELLAEGRTTEQIAEALHLSKNTIRNHIARVFSKLGVHSRLEAVAAATRLGLVSPPTPV